jgi:hypothetical protein
VIRAEDAAESLPRFNLHHRFRFGFAIDESIAQSLVIAFQVIVLGELLDCQPQVPLIDGDGL